MGTAGIASINICYTDYKSLKSSAWEIGDLRSEENLVTKKRWWTHVDDKGQYDIKSM